MRIFYLCPDFDKPAGGVKVIYKHASILKENGYDARILHGKIGFKCTWFAHNCTIAYFDQIEVKPTDYIVFPEIYYHLSHNPTITLKDKIRKLRGVKVDYYAAKFLWQTDCKKIIFNQNAYHTFLDISSDFSFEKVDFAKNIDAILCISNQNKSYLEYAFQQLLVQRVQWSLDYSTFAFEYSKKKKRIAYMPRKNESHAKQVVSILRNRGNLNGFEFVPIANMNEAEVATALAESLLFLSFGYPEGLPLPPAEAMASGCIVVGYDGGGGQEYFHPNHSFTIPFGDIIAFCDKIEQICTTYDSNRVQFEAIAFNAQKFIRETYSASNESLKLLEAWKKILSKNPESTSNE